MDDIMSIDNKEPVREGSEELSESTPEPEPDPSAAPEMAAQQKRKGGRKPIYATSEERKQRNRQAQAAFRERRTEYIKQLEETIRVHETNLHSLQTAHRSAADECLMLRYKNSLLERILLEKGIDVQAELRAKTGSPHLGPTHVPQNMAQPPTFQRAIMNRHHQARRSNSAIAPKLEPGVAMHTNQSPPSRPTPSSHASSPTSNSPGFSSGGVMTPPASDAQFQLQQQQSRLQAAKPQSAHSLLPSFRVLGSPPVMGVQGQTSNSTTSTGGTPITTAYFTSPFQNHQNHYEQLEQEYDAQADVVEDDLSPSGPGPYPQPIDPQPLVQQVPRQHGLQMGGAPGYGGNNTSNSTGVPSLLDPYDPMLDMDPFGLSASMQFPTQFPFDSSSTR